MKYLIYIILLLNCCCCSKIQIQTTKQLKCYQIEATNEKLTQGQELKLYQVNNDLLKQCLINYNKTFNRKYDKNIFLIKKEYIDKEY